MEEDTAVARCSTQAIQEKVPAGSENLWSVIIYLQRVSELSRSFLNLENCPYSFVPWSMELA